MKLRPVVLFLILAGLTLPPRASAEPVALKLAYFTSDQTLLYRALIKPFVDAVNAEAGGLVHIDIYPSGALGMDPLQQAQMVLDGVADIAFVAPGYTPELFPDNAIVEMPGLYRDESESSLTYTGLVAAQALRGYEDFVVVAAVATEPETVHMRTPVSSLGDLTGKKIRVNNAMQAEALERLGAIPIPLPVNKVSEAISSGTMDGAVVAVSPLTEFGIGRVATHHYLLGVATAPLAVLMSRKTFDSLPGRAKEIILKYSGEWAAARFIETWKAANIRLIGQLMGDPERSVVIPAPSDVEAAQAVYRDLAQEWIARSADNASLFDAAQAEIARQRGLPGGEVN